MIALPTFSLNNKTKYDYSMMDPAVPDFCGAIQQQQAPEHNQHTTHSQLHPDPWHRHNEYHGKILYVGALYIGV